MTSVPPAEPRPPHPRPYDPSRPFTNPSLGFNGSPALKKVDSDVFGVQDGQSIDDRPSKKRKLSTDNVLVPSGPELSTSAARTLLVDDFRVLSTVLRGKPADEPEPESTEQPPLPRRPWQTASMKMGEEEPKATHRARSPVEVPNTPDAISTPETAPYLSNKRPIAYSPWTGKHAEDVLSETSVKQGFYHQPLKPQERETNTARVPLYNALKHRSGTESLSTLFSIVLEAKNKHGLISSASTFKPPPRVTLAEAKRRSWIADLADPNVPLRKLCRTIPQGIRGQTLLEQCIQHNVPLSRAIWFAKCVGANEIRTLKRKGTTPQAAVGTESKWLREWTGNTEQFAESILAQVGQPAWRSNIQYALRLATRLYLENLIDRDHYLDWIIKSFSTSTDDRLPFWLMVIHIYKQDITRFRKRGRMLAEALVNRYARLKNSTHGMTQSLVKKLREAIRGIALHRSSCFLMPDIWPAARESLQSCLDANSLREDYLLRRLDQANERCMGSNKHSYLAKPSPKDQVVGILDEARAPYDPASLSQRLIAACANIQLLSAYCLEWATTRFRCGSARVYLTSRLLRRWQRQGYDVDAAILQFLTSFHQTRNDCDLEALKHVFADLSRAQTFSVSKYLQWLNVRGHPLPNSARSEAVLMASGRSIRRQKCSDGADLLMDLSTFQPSGHVMNLRNALLSRAGFDAAGESLAVDEILAQLSKDLSMLITASSLDAALRKAMSMLLSGWNWHVRSRISYWLRSYAAEAVKTPMSKKNDLPLQHPQAMSKAQFDFIRTALETLGDEAVLADVIGLCSSFNDEQLQASLVETISRHADAFSAIGALDLLSNRFCQIYMSLRHVKLTMPLFATALLDLCMAFPTKCVSVRLLQQDLVRGDRGRAMAACSPFSDGIAESLQQAESTFIDDFEAVLQSEPSMHEQTMDRLFTLLTERIEKQQGTIIGEGALFSYCQLMARLRLCRRAQGDQLLKTWLTKALSKYAATFTRNLVYCLIGTGCLTIDILVQATIAIGRTTVVPHHAWLASPDVTSEHPCGYAATTKWRDFEMSNPQEALNLLADAGKSARNQYERQSCTSFILGNFGVETLSVPSYRMLNTALRSLLGGGDGSVSIASTLRSLDVFSVRFMQTNLQLQAARNSEDDNTAIANALIDLVSQPDRSETPTNHILALLDATANGVAIQVRQAIEEKVFSLLPKLPGAKSAEGACIDAEAMSHLHQAVDQAFELCTSSTAPSLKSGQRLVDVLSQVLKHLGHVQLATALPKTPTATSPSTSSLPLPQSIAGQLLQPPSLMDCSTRPLSPSAVEYLCIILQLLCLQRPSTLSQPQGSSTALPPPPKQSQSDHIKILALLASIVTHPSLTSPLPSSDSASQSAIRECVDFAHDVMATFVDDLGDEGRLLTARLLKDKLKDATDGRLKWLFGSVNALGSDMSGGEELGKGLLVMKRDADGVGKSKVMGEWKPKVWEVLETSGRGDSDVAVGLGMFGARRI